jgi:hypothetical protein
MREKEEIDVLAVIAIDLVIDTPVGGWAHTHGMDKFSLPELEIRGVPEFFFEEAARMLNMFASYMLNSGEKVYVGQHLQFSDLQRFALVEAKPLENAEHHYEYPRWTLVEPSQCTCSRCVDRAKLSDDRPWYDHHGHMKTTFAFWPRGGNNDIPN